MNPEAFFIAAIASSAVMRIVGIELWTGLNIHPIEFQFHKRIAVNLQELHSMRDKKKGDSLNRPCMNIPICMMNVPVHFRDDILRIESRPKQKRPCFCQDDIPDITS